MGAARHAGDRRSARLARPALNHGAQRSRDLTQFGRDVASEGFTDVVVLGMGGSSLAPEVFQSTFGNADGHPRLTVLDSTHPAAVTALTSALDLSRTLFVVSSKSGTTTEMLSFFYHFWARLTEAGNRTRAALCCRHRPRHAAGTAGA